MIKNINTLAERLKGITINGEEVTPDKFIEHIKSDNEIEVSASDITIFTDDELTGFKTKIGGTAYNDGVQFGVEKTIKSIKNINELDANLNDLISFTNKEGKNIYDFDKIAENVSVKLTDTVKNKKYVNDNVKIKELQDSLTNLQSKYQSDISSWESKFTEKENEINTFKTTSILSQSIPKIDGYKQNHLIAAFNSDGYGVTFENGEALPTFKGKVIKDKLENPEKIDNVINNWLTDNGYMQTRNGRGDNNNVSFKSSNYKDKNDLMKYMFDNNIDPTSNHGLSLLDEFKNQKA